MQLFNITPQELIAMAIILLVAFPVHELAHAFTANAFGDETPRNSGRLTINPLKHLDPIGTLMLIITQGFGWAKPVPINPYALQRRSPAAVMWVSLAGPLSNLVMAIIAAIPFRLGLVHTFNPVNSAGYWVYNILINIIIINLVLMLFNLIPLPPLDGAKVLEYFLPPSWARSYESIQSYGPIILLAIIFLLPFLGINVLSYVLNPAISALLRILLGVPA